MANFSVNGQEFQHATTSVTALWAAGEFPFVSHTKVNFKQTVEKKWGNGASGAVDHYTIDNAKHEGSITMRLSEFIRFREQLESTANGARIGQIAFDLHMVLGNNIANLQEYTLHTCILNSTGVDSESNQDALMVELPFGFLAVDPPFIDFSLVAAGA
jgi:hypothetical protein